MLSPCGCTMEFRIIPAARARARLARSARAARYVGSASRRCSRCAYPPAPARPSKSPASRARTCRVQTPTWRRSAPIVMAQAAAGAARSTRASVRAATAAGVVCDMDTRPRSQVSRRLRPRQPPVRSCPRRRPKRAKCCRLPRLPPAKSFPHLRPMRAQQVQTVMTTAPALVHRPLPKLMRRQPYPMLRAQPPRRRSQHRCRCRRAS